MKKTYLTPAIAGITSLLAVSVSAQSSKHAVDPVVERSYESNIVGHLGISAGYNGVREFDGSSQLDDGDVWFAAVDGSITIPFATTWLITLDAYARYDDFESADNIDSDEDPEWEYTLGGHLLYQFTPDTRAGLLVGYGDTRPQDNDRGDAYDVWMVGGELHHFISDDLMFYTQFGYAFKGRDGQDDDEGYSGGLFGRVGATYFIGERSTLNLDVEFAGTTNYSDDEHGRFFGGTLSYLQQLGDSSPLYFTCFGRYDHINGLDEGGVDEWQVGIGLRYVFGAGSQRDAARKGASIGMPRLPTRASAWTEYID